MRAVARLTEQWWLRPLFLSAVIAYLIYRLSDIGWQTIWSHLPQSPWFYLLSPVMFLILPAAEVMIYGRLFGQAVPGGLAIFARKRVLNDAVLSYSGEAYLFARFAERPEIGRARAVETVRDNNLVSALVSNTMTILLVGAAVLIGRSDWLAAIQQSAPSLLASFAVFCVALYVVVLIFFRRISALSRREFWFVSAVHSAKLLLVMAAQLLQWSLGLPGQAMTTWLLVLAAYMLLRRVPFLPNTELVFLGVGLSLTGLAGAQSDAMAGMLFAVALTSQIVQLAAFVITSFNRDAVVR